MDRWDRNQQKSFWRLLPGFIFRDFGVVGGAGCAASGKTIVCDVIIEQLRDQRVVLVNQEFFYNNLTEEELAQVHEYNFEHPDAFDMEKLLSCMGNLKCWQAVNIQIMILRRIRTYYQRGRFKRNRCWNPSSLTSTSGMIASLFSAYILYRIQQGW